jgi:hypothetical protein
MFFPCELGWCEAWSANTPGSHNYILPYAACTGPLPHLPETYFPESQPKPEALQLVENNILNGLAEGCQTFGLIGKTTPPIGFLSDSLQFENRASP